MRKFSVELLADRVPYVPAVCRTIVVLIVFLFVCGRDSFAVGPHQVLLLINSDSEDSVVIGETYAKLRSIPEINVVHVKLGAKPKLAISPERFRQNVWDPAWKAAFKRSISNQIFAVIFSAGFPTTVTTDPCVSITGFTFLRCREPSSEEVELALYRSPYFAGPNSPDGVAHPSQTFDSARLWLDASAPMPAMMLAFTGQNGQSRESALECLSCSARSDSTFPTGTVFFVLNDDVRTKSRSWQFPRAVSELRKLGVSAHIVNDLPKTPTVIAGIMAGSPTLNPSEGLYWPGAMAEHMTSFGGVFSEQSQTKLTAWLDAGAAGSSGTVVEPRSAWPKFPSARFFVHHALGCTMIESFYQAILSPLQILLVGDPLAAPWSKKAEIIFDCVPKGPTKESFTVSALVNSPIEDVYPVINWLIDGVHFAQGAKLHVEADSLQPGTHTIRAVASHAGLVKSQVFKEAVIHIE